MKQYIFLLILLILGVSCESDFLTEDPKGVLSPDVFFSSDQVEQASDRIIKSFGGIYGQAGCVAPFMGGDDLSTHPTSNKDKFREIDIFNATGNNDRTRHYWSNCYTTIRSANAVLANLNDEESPIDQATIDDIKGIAHFYRALSYSFLTRIFGEVPLVIEWTTDANLDAQKASVSEIYAQIISDMQAAEQLLPNVRPESPSDRGGYPGAKPCKGTVKALASQVYLTMAGWPLKETSNYALAAQKAKEVIDNADTYGYELLADPWDLWTYENNRTNKEIILGAYFSFELGHLSMHGPLGPRPEEYHHRGIGWASGWCDYLAEISFFERFPEGRRKEATYQTIIDVPGVGEVSWDDERTYRQHPYFRKYHDEHPSSSWAGDRTGQIIRFAEVLLNYAEAQAMANGGPDATAYDAVNQIRNRAGLPDLTPGLSAEAFRDSVIAERGWEFAGGEAPSRWFDLIRTETVEAATMLRHENEIPLVKSPTKDDYWMPIPDEDKSLNENL